MLPWCSVCERAWLLSWDQKEDAFNIVLLPPETLAALNGDTTPARLTAFCLTPWYASYRWAISGFVRGFFERGAYDPAPAAAELLAALGRPGLTGAVAAELLGHLVFVAGRARREGRAAGLSSVAAALRLPERDDFFERHTPSGAARARLELARTLASLGHALGPETERLPEDERRALRELDDLELRLHRSLHELIAAEAPTTPRAASRLIEAALEVRECASALRPLKAKEVDGLFSLLDRLEQAPRGTDADPDEPAFAVRRVLSQLSHVGGIVPERLDAIRRRSD